MTHATLAITSLLLVLPGCSDYSASGFGSGVGTTAPRPGASGPTVHAAIAPAKVSAASVHIAIEATAVRFEPQAAKTPAGIFDIDLPTTAKHGGLFAGLIEGKIRGSSLELSADGSYVGRKGDEKQSAGTFRLDGDVLRMKQTHEKGKPAANSGTATLDGDELTVKTKRHGLSITLVFQRRQ